MASQTTSRTSSPSSRPKNNKSMPRRPKLMRASATAPSLATSNASRKDLALAGYQSSRAATLLNRVASYSSSREQREGYGKRQSGAFCESPVEVRSAGSHQHEGMGMVMERKEPFEIVISQCGNYFSFPSFEYFEDYREGEEGMDRNQDQGVP